MARLPPSLRPLWPYAKRLYTLVTRLTAGLTIRLSSRRGGYLPSAVAETIESAAAVDASVTVDVVAPSDAVERQVPDGSPPALQHFRDQVRAVFAPQVVVDLPAGRVLGPHRAVISGDGTLVHGLVRYFGTSRALEHPMFLHPGVVAPRDVEGTVAVLASRGDANYYHFLHDVLPRLSVLDRWCDPMEIDRYYLPMTTHFQRSLIDAIGLPADRIIDSDVVCHVRAERLVVPSVPDLDLNHPEWSTRFLRERLLPLDAGLVPGQRIYVTRGSARHSRVVLNEGDVIDALLPLGFTVIDPSTMTVRDQIQVFAQAEVIVAPHGAALANLAFSSAGASVIELFAPDFVQSCYWKLSTTVPGLRYRYVVGQGRSSRRSKQMGVSSDILLDVGSLKRMVNDVIRMTPRRSEIQLGPARSASGQEAAGTVQPDSGSVPGATGKASV